MELPFMATPFLLLCHIIKTSPHTLKIGYNQITPSLPLLYTHATLFIGGGKYCNVEFAIHC